jgi:hypothetical protein
MQRNPNQLKKSPESNTLQQKEKDFTKELNRTTI